METVLNAIADWIKGILAGAIMSNLSGLLDSVNEQVGEIATQVGTSPADFEPRVFEMIRGVSNSAILPIAGVFLTLVACYELVDIVNGGVFHEDGYVIGMSVGQKNRYPALNPTF